MNLGVNKIAMRDNRSIWDKTKCVKDFKEDDPKCFDAIREDINNGDFVLKIALKYEKSPEFIRIMKTFLSIKL